MKTLIFILSLIATTSIFAISEDITDCGGGTMAGEKSATITSIAMPSSSGSASAN